MQTIKKFAKQDLDGLVRDLEERLTEAQNREIYELSELEQVQNLDIFLFNYFYQYKYRSKIGI